MTKTAKRPERIEELPDRQEHMRKIALTRKLEHPEYAADDPTRTVNRPGSGYRFPRGAPDNDPRPGFGAANRWQTGIQRLKRPKMADRSPGRHRLRCSDDGVGIDAIVPIEVGDRAGLAEVLDAEGAHAMAADPA